MSHNISSEYTSEYIGQQVQLALAEDIGTGDATADLVPASQQAIANVISREAAVLCGHDWFNTVFQQLDSDINIDWYAKDGDQLEPEQLVCTLTGPARPILSGERAALNFLQTLSGTATQTQHYVKAVAGTGTKILDTRKTIPNLRLAQKYAVQCGGGVNHRIGLYDAILIKENHINAAGSITAAIAQAKARYPKLFLEVEVENLSELDEAITAGAQRVLLDNMGIRTLQEAVAKAKGKLELEASGGITLETIRAVADTGVDYISIGSITKHLHAIDFSMRFA